MTRIRMSVAVSPSARRIPRTSCHARSARGVDASIGSTTVYPYDDDTLESHELGASIFVKVNKNLWRAVDEFGLERVEFDGDDDNDIMGIWDGHEFVLTVRSCVALHDLNGCLMLHKTGGGSFYSGWLDKLKILWRYGYKAPSKTQAL